MLRLTLKSVRGHLLRFVLTLFAVSLGVAFVAGSFVLTDSLRSTFDTLIATSSQGTDVSVRGQEGGSNVTGEGLTTRLPLDLVDTLRQVDGVQRAVPDVQGSILLVGKNGTAVRNGGAPTLGFAYAADDPVLSLVRGRAPQGPDDVAVESSTLKRSGLSVGDTTQALIGSEPRTVRVVGEVRFDGPLAGATLALLDDASARAAFSPDGAVPSFSLTAADGVSQQTLRDRVAALLPADAEAVTGQALQQEVRDQVDVALGFFNTFLLVFAGISLFVGAFIIVNTFSMLVAQRSRELALLRAIGASRGQVRRVVLGESLVVGLLGSVLGLLLGIGLAAGLQPVISAIGIESSGDVPVRLATVLWSLGLGTSVTLVAALLPAVRAGRVAPVEAMRDDVVLTAKGVRGRGLVGTLGALAGVAVLLLALRGEVNWPLMGVGAALVVLGVVVAAPLVTRPVVRVVAAPFVLLAGTVGRLARENSLRNPRRTATTATALMIGLALMAAISVVAQSTKASVSDLVDSQLTADYVLNGGGQAQFPAGVGEKVAALPDVASVATIGGLGVEVGDQTAFALAADAAGIEDNVRVTMTEGSLQRLDDGDVLLSSTLAKDRGWKVGDTLPASLGTLKDRSLTVGGVFEDNQVLGGEMIVPRSLYRQAVPTPEQGDFLVYVKASERADVAALRSQLVDVVKPYIVVSVQDGAEFTDSQAAQVNQLLGILYVLLALSVVIAVLGIINTLALSVFERTREIGLLRAVGLTRAQLFRMVTLESVATAVFGAILGAALGLGLGIALQRGAADQGLETLAIPWVTLAVVIAAAAVAGVVAAVLPALRAMRMDVLRAIATE
jgi:putative ABC transport system permease protein